MNESIPNEQSVPPSGTNPDPKSSSEYTFDQFVKEISEVAVKSCQRCQ